jgi:outer membrane protein assembly factor BamA
MRMPYVLLTFPLIALGLGILGTGALAAPAERDTVDFEALREEATEESLYVPDLVAPEYEGEIEKEIILDEGPDIDVRFGHTMKPFILAKEKDHPEFEAGFTASFDRVDGLSLFFHQSFGNEERLYPTVQLMEGYAFDGRRWRYRFDFEQPLFRPRSFSIGTAVYLITDTYDSDISDTAENSLTALFLKHDYRDYFEREGALVFARQRFWQHQSLTLQYSEDTHRSLETTSKGLFHRHSREFRPNPPVDEGTWAGVTCAYELDSRSSKLEPGLHWHRLYYERAHNKDVSGSDYTRLAADLRTYLRMNPGQYLNVKVGVGSTVSGTLPFQREFCVGGLGTLNAHPYKEFRGDQMFLVNAEYLIDIVKRFQFIFFVDAGKAWNDWDALKDQKLEFDVGIGIGQEEGLRLCVAKTPRDENSEIVWILRLQRPF